MVYSWQTEPGHEYQEYKGAKKELRKEIIKAELEYEREEMMKIYKTHIEHKYCWALVNSYRSMKRII